MTKQYTCGASSISFQEPVFIQSCASVTGPKEGDGPLGSCFDMICPDPMFGASTWEAAESTMQKEAAALAIGKAGLKPSDIRHVGIGQKKHICILFAQKIKLFINVTKLCPYFYEHSY